jgi:hypothetical protein
LRSGAKIILRGKSASQLDLSRIIMKKKIQAHQNYGGRIVSTVVNRLLIYG